MKVQEFSRQLTEQLKQYDGLTVKDDKIILMAKNKVIENYIFQIILQDWARQKALIIKPNQVEKQINHIRSGYPDDLSFRRALSEAGVAFEHWKDRIRLSLLQKRIISELKVHIIDPDKKELKAYYAHHKSEFLRPAQVRVSQIVLDTESHANQIMAELKKGKKIKNLAPKFSITPEASQKGDLGWIVKGQFKVYDAAFKMAKGSRSKIIKSPYGFHIFKVVNKRRLKTLSFVESKSKIRKILMDKKAQALYSSWLDQQIKDIRVKKNDELISSLIIETKG